MEEFFKIIDIILGAILQFSGVVLQIGGIVLKICVVVKKIVKKVG